MPFVHVRYIRVSTTTLEQLRDQLCKTTHTDGRHPILRAGRERECAVKILLHVAASMDRICRAGRVPNETRSAAGNRLSHLRRFALCDRVIPWRRCEV